MASLSILNKEGIVVAESVTPNKFIAFKRQYGKGCAVLVELAGGEELLVDTVKLLRRLPKSIYKARLLQRVTVIPKELDCSGRDVWVEA